MKLLLASGGLVTDELIETCEKLVGKKCKNTKVVTIEDAVWAEEGDKTWFTESKAGLAELFPLGLTTLNLKDLADTRQKIANADLIYCFGGNTAYLSKYFRKTGFAEILPEILTEKVWVGSSAGSCVLCHEEDEETAREVFHEELGEYLGIVPAVILPHYHGDFDYDEARIDRVAEKSKYPVYTLSDRAALKVTGRPGKITMEVVGEDYVVNMGHEFNEGVNDAAVAAAEALKKAQETLKTFLGRQ